MKSRRLGLCVSLGLLAVAHDHARADNAEAEQLFRSGQQLMQSGNLDAACAAFAKSDQVEPSINTQMNLGDCEEKRGRYAAAWRVFVAVEQATHTDSERAAINTVARQRIDGLAGKLSFLQVTVPPAVVGIPGLEITIDDVPLSQSFWNGAVAVDNGVHRVDARAPGYVSNQQEVTVTGEGASTAVTIDALVAEAKPSSPAPGIAGPAPWMVGMDIGREEMHGAEGQNFFVGVAGGWHHQLTAGVFFRLSGDIRYQGMDEGPATAFGAQFSPAFGYLFNGRILLAWQPTFGYSSAGDQDQEGAEIVNSAYFYGKFMLGTVAYVSRSYEVGLTLDYDDVIGHDETYEVGLALRYHLAR